MGTTTPFHLAIPVKNLEKCREFYTRVLECSEGRSSNNWVDLDLFGHQLVLHQKENYELREENPSNVVDGHDVPVPHFGVVLEWEKWQDLADRMRKLNVSFVIEPYIRFEGEVGEQATMFFLDPESNALEFKAFK
ncbi:MAG: VOC family protein, partial [Flavobacteriales bacterium]|nr:VOC family protein [Flavobacteriales bacterium]